MKGQTLPPKNPTKPVISKEENQLSSNIEVGGIRIDKLISQIMLMDRIGVGTNPAAKYNQNTGIPLCLSRQEPNDPSFRGITRNVLKSSQDKIQQIMKINNMAQNIVSSFNLPYNFCAKNSIIQTNQISKHDFMSWRHKSGSLADNISNKGQQFHPNLSPKSVNRGGSLSHPVRLSQNSREHAERESSRQNTLSSLDDYIKEQKLIQCIAPANELFMSGQKIAKRIPVSQRSSEIPPSQQQKAITFSNSHKLLPKINSSEYPKNRFIKPQSIGMAVPSNIDVPVLNRVTFKVQPQYLASVSDSSTNGVIQNSCAQNAIKSSPLGISDGMTHYPENKPLKKEKSFTVCKSTHLIPIKPDDDAQNDSSSSNFHKNTPQIPEEISKRPDKKFKLNSFAPLNPKPLHVPSIAKVEPSRITLANQSKGKSKVVKTNRAPITGRQKEQAYASKQKKTKSLQDPLTVQEFEVTEDLFVESLQGYIVDEEESFSGTWSGFNIQQYMKKQKDEETANQKSVFQQLNSITNGVNLSLNQNNQTKLEMKISQQSIEEDIQETDTCH